MKSTSTGQYEVGQMVVYGGCGVSELTVITDISDHTDDEGNAEVLYLLSGLTETGEEWELGTDKDTLDLSAKGWVSHE